MRRGPLLLPLLALLGCVHAEAAKSAAAPAPGDLAGAAAAAPAPALPAAPPPDHSAAAKALSAEAHALQVAEGELFWKRWTTGQGALPAVAAQEHARLFTADSLQAIALAAGEAKDEKVRVALRLLHGHLATRAIARAAAAEGEALERARTLLAFSPAGAERPEHERDLDKLLLEERSASRRAAIAVAEARAAATLLPVALARDAAYAKAREALQLPSWAELIDELHRTSPEQLAALAERTLRDTESAAQRAVADSALQNLGLTADRVHRADLPRLLRVTAADPEFQPGLGYSLSRRLLAGLGLEAAALDRVQLDAEPRPAKGARPLALLVDPPADVRLSYRGAGGLDEQRALLHETARAAGAVFTDPARRWELASLGDGAGAEGSAQLFEELAGDPRWLREATKLRGEPLDELVHLMATRRLLSARRAAAMVLFEVRRRQGSPSADEQAKLYRGLLQRATFALFTDEDALRWPLEADSFIRSAALLEGELLAAQLEIALRRLAGDRTGAAGALDKPRPDLEEEGEDSEVDEEEPAAPAPPPASSAAPAAGQPAAPPWWRSPRAGALLRQIWSLGRSASTADVLRALEMSSLDPWLLAALAEEQLDYRAPERPPQPPKPDYREMRDDRGRRRKKKTRKKRQ